MQEAIAGLIQVARIHDEQIDRNSQQIAANSQQIKENADEMKEFREGLREQREHINALIRIVESHITNHS
jgi:septal ring factor EnvC (AmiA/AmiB activator)